MRISSRLHAIADKVERGCSAADIGTDHGYVPMLLVKNGTCQRVIMSDISEGSLAKARDTFREAGLTVAEDSFRVGDGLETIGYGEVDDVIIGGLGGFTIINILDKDPEKSRSYSKLILQPRKHSGPLRHYLYTHGWDITEEYLAPEGKFVCEIISAVHTGEVSRQELYPAEDIRWKYPETMVKADRGLAAARIGWKLSSIEEQIRSLSASSADRTDQIMRLRDEAEYLRSLVL